jgi:uncharacterized membrane protein
MISTLSAWQEMVAALAAFFASHLIPARPAIRGFLIHRLGKGIYTAAFSAISLVILAWLIEAAARAPQVRLWDFEIWQLWVPNIVMPFVCLLTAFGVAAPNPFSFGGQPSTAFDPNTPGVAGVTRHPLLWAIVLWAAAHIVPNGDLAHVLLFGLFTVLGLAGMLALDRRGRRQMGQAEWQRRAQRTSLIPFAAIFGNRFRPGPLRLQQLVRVLAAFGLYGVLLSCHEALIGVSPLPPL